MTQHSPRLRTLASLTLALLIPVAGCGGGKEGGPSSPGGTGEPAVVVVDGSSTVFRISKAVQESYSVDHPEVNVVVDNHGTGGGFSRYLQGEVDVVDASRDAKPDETAKAKAQGIVWTRFLIAYDGITVVVNPKNDFVKVLTVDQLKAIWAPGSMVKTWKDVDPSWPNRKIILYSPDTDSGTFEFFTEAVVGKAKSQRDDVQASSDDNTLVNGVAGDPDGLGYFGYAYYAANPKKLRAIPVQKGEGPAVAPSPATVLDKSYAPLSRPLYIFAKNNSLRKPSTSGFVKYYLDNARKFAEKSGYVAPTAADLAADLKDFEAATNPSKTADASPTPANEPAAR